MLLLRTAYRNIQFLACYMALVTNPTKCLSLKVLSSSGSPEAAEYEQKFVVVVAFVIPSCPFEYFVKCQLHFLSPTRKQSRITIALRLIRQLSFVLTRPRSYWFLKSPYSLFSKHLFAIKFMSFIGNGAGSEEKFTFIFLITFVSRHVRNEKQVIMLKNRLYVRLHFGLPAPPGPFRAVIFPFFHQASCEDGISTRRNLNVNTDAFNSQHPRDDGLTERVGDSQYSH